LKSKVYKTKPLRQKLQKELNSSQVKVHKFQHEKFNKARIIMVGAGAIGSHVSLALVRKGIGYLEICDDDTVEYKNLTRQLFSIKDIGKNKAIAMARILSKQGLSKTTIQAYPCRFQEAFEAGVDLTRIDAVICGVDNNPTRQAVAGFCLENKLPLVMSAVSRDANQMYCVVQEPGQACFGCILPEALNDSRYPCNLPGIIDIIQVVSGMTVYALDTVLMQRHREWNIKMVFLDGSVPDSSALLQRKPGCVLCGHV